MALVRRRSPHHHYSPLAQVTATNFNALEIAWRFKTDSLGPGPEFSSKARRSWCTASSTRPPVRDGRSWRSTRRPASCLWAHAEREGRARGSIAAPAVRPGRRLLDRRQRRARALRHHRLPPRGPRRKTGARIPSFGKDGIVDLKDEVVFGKGQQIDREAGEIGLHATPAITKDGVVMIGAAMLEGGTPKTHNNTKGLVRGFDVRTGRRLLDVQHHPQPR